MKLKSRISVSGFVEITVDEIEVIIFEADEAREMIENLQEVIEDLEMRIEDSIKKTN